MAKKPSFDEARRKLEATLEGMGTSPASGASEAEARGSPHPDPGASARVAPRRRAGLVPPREGVPPTPPGPEGPTLAGDEPQRAPTIRLGEAEHSLPGTDEPPGEDRAPARERQPLPPSEALARLLVGAALLGLDGLATRSGAWEAVAGIERHQQAPPAAEGEIGSGRFRHATIGWILETEERLRPRGNPISWLRAVVTYIFGTVFSVVIDLLPLPRPGLRRRRGRPGEPTDEETRRWVRRGEAEEEPSRRFARAALEDIVDRAIVYLADRPAVGRALGTIVRSPAMDDAVSQILQGSAIEQAISRVATSPALDEAVAAVARSPALDEAVTRVVRSPALEEAVERIVRTPAMEEAITYLVSTKAMNEAIDTLAKSPALVDLVTTQSTSVVAEILEEVREHGVSADRLVEGLVRRLLRRPPRSALPLEANVLVIVEREQQPER